jgi:hypothetical protein
MFNAKCLYKKPLIQIRSKFTGFPNNFDIIYSAQFWYYLDSDLIETIVAMRVYPHNNYVALKLRERGSKKFISIVIKEPELRILHTIWECKNEGFNYGIEYYLTRSNSAFQQWIARVQHSRHCLEWYADLTDDKKHE